MLILHQNGCGKSLDVFALCPRKTRAGTALCSCRKNGIDCMSDCSKCCGELCTNAKTDDIIDDDLNDSSTDGFDFERNIFYYDIKRPT